MDTVSNRHHKKSRHGMRPMRPKTRHGSQPADHHTNHAPPARFPADLAVPLRRGPIITTMAWPETVRPLVARSPAPILPIAGRKATKRAGRRAAALARATAMAMPTPEDLIILPAPPPPLVKIPTPLPLPVPAQTAPVAPAEPGIAAGVPAVPNRSTGTALVVRRQGLVDVIAFALRDSGRRLARWSSARRRADDMKQKLARAEARMRAMEAQLQALQMIQERISRAPRQPLR